MIATMPAVAIFRAVMLVQLVEVAVSCRSSLTTISVRRLEVWRKALGLVGNVNIVAWYLLSTPLPSFRSYFLKWIPSGRRQSSSRDIASSEDCILKILNHALLELLRNMQVLIFHR